VSGPPAPDTLRWLLLATHVPPSGAGGGMIRYAVELGRALQRRHDIELHVLACPESAPALGAVLGVPETRVHVLPGGVLTASARQRLARGAEVFASLDTFDVVHGTKHLLPARASGVRVLTVHDLLPLDRPGDFGRAKRLLLPRSYLRSLRDADVLVCVSAATRERLLVHVPEVRDRAEVVPLAMASSLLDAHGGASAALEARRFALVVGDASPRKNLRFVSRLWPAVRRRHPDLLLAVAGPAGWGVDDGLHELDALVAEGGALRLGHIDDATLRWAYEHAAVVLCPSRLEGFGLPALEAVTFGAPLVRSTDPALAEASAGAGRAVALDDPLGWVDAIDAAVRAGRAAPAATAAAGGSAAGAPGDALAPRVPRGWDDVADATVALARRARHR
jgi:glycosyltransferase involved in cell wall biosynthesis